MSIGPIQAFVIGFPDNDLFEGRIAEELGRLSDVGQIRIIDAVFVIRDDDGAAVLSVSDLDDDQRAELRAAVGALVGLGLAGGEGAVVGAALGGSIDADAPTAAESVAAGLLARGFGEGDVLAHRSLTPEDLIAFGIDIAVDADIEEAEADADSEE